MKRLIVDVIILILLMILLIYGGLWLDKVYAEEHAGAVLYVTANRLNGRSAPRKTGFVECIFDYGDSLVATGKWSLDHKWVEVYGGEMDKVWVDIRYVTEIKENITVRNLHPNKFRIRSKPFDGKVRGYLKKNGTLVISQVVLGWGKCSKGWVDLDYLIVEDD